VSARPRHPVLVVSLTGQVIQRLRKRAGLSQERLAAEAGIDRTQVGRLERYGVSAGIATMHALLCAIGASWAEFGAALDAELSAQSGQTPRRP
jgi:transcriptional regulator with XRE-family HTH domain